MFIKRYTHTPRVHLFAMKNSPYKRIRMNNNNIATKLDFLKLSRFTFLLKKKKDILRVCNRKTDVSTRVCGMCVWMIERIKLYIKNN